MSKHIDLKTSKWLKEVGFDSKVTRMFDLISTNVIDDAPKGNYNLTKHSVSIPEQDQVVDWLLEKYGIWVSVDLIENTHEDKTLMFQFKAHKIKNNTKYSTSIVFNSPTEAYREAFNHIRENNILK